MKQLLYSPETGMPGGTIDASPVTQIRYSSNVPDKDASLLAVSQAVNSKWAASGFITLVWKTQPGFATEVASFKDELEQRNTGGGKRSLQTRELENLDAQVEDALPYVKSYINEKFGPPNAKAHYPAFGIVHRNSNYELPRDREQRKDALRMMVEAIAANGFDSKLYGTAFWANIKTRYDEALEAATSGASTVSGSVSDLVPLRAGLRRVLRSILLLLEANYPDTYEQIRREWGFLKETY